MHVLLLNLLCRFHLAWPGAFCLGSVSGWAYMLCFLGSVSEPLWETFFPFFLFWVGHFSIHPFGFGLLEFAAVFFSRFLFLLLCSCLQVCSAVGVFCLCYVNYTLGLLGLHLSCSFFMCDALFMSDRRVSWVLHLVLY